MNPGCVLSIYPEVDWTCTRFVRDIHGCIFVVLPDEYAEDVAKITTLNTSLVEKLSSYASSVTPATFFSKILAGDQLLTEPSVIYTYKDLQIPLLDRRAMGQHWVLEPKTLEQDTLPRFVFFSLKGGVGRSTALALWARQLCLDGKTVLVIDLDLEAPGLGAQLLEKTGKPLYGVGDWLVEDLVSNQPQKLIPDMAKQSPIVPAGLWVVPAFGASTDNKPHNVISKLARAYLDKPTEEGQQLFTQRLQVLVKSLEDEFNPDLVLIDSRAGLHETVASALLHLNAEVLCFAVDLEVTWQGYKYLFSHLAQLVQNVSSEYDWRDRFKMVAARFNSKNSNSFVENAYSLWVDTLYDATADVLNQDFSFDLLDKIAPHYPLIIPRSDIFEAFEPCQDLSRLQEEQIQEVFGHFFAELNQRLEERFYDHD